MASRNDGENPSHFHERYALRVLRIEPGQEGYLLMLSATLSGLLTHWWKGRSLYCPGEGPCKPSLHAEPLIWKGYVAAALWQEKGQLWFPCVLEVTESTELDMRGRYKRGQIWFLDRRQQQRGKRSAITAAYQRSLDPAGVLPEFDVLPIVAQLYHCPTIRLGEENPMPGKIFAAPIAGDSPSPAANADNFDPLEAREAFKRLMDERKRRNGKGGEQ